jgi:hypothetical protein
MYGPMSKLNNKPLIKLSLGEIVRNNQKTGFYAVFSFILGPFWPLNGPKKVFKGMQVGGTYGLMSELKDKP